MFPSSVPYYLPHLPPPPPGYQLVYVPPPPHPPIPAPHASSSSSHSVRTRSPSQPTSNGYDSDESENVTDPAGSHSSTPDLSHLNLLPTPVDTPSSSTCPRSSLRTDHECVLRKYEMVMRQQPVQARMCGVGEKSDRRPVDPTPIIQLKVIDGNGDDITPADDRSRSLRRPSPGPAGMSFMQNPYYFLFACLVGGDEQEDELHVIDDGKTRFLTGTPVSSLYHLKDVDNTDAAFFVFPDLGVRKEGRYKLKLTLFEIVDQEVFYCTTMYTSTFSVYSAKKFPGMSKATDLSKSFAEQGLKIRVRKDPRQPARNIKVKRKSSANESEDDNALQLKRSRGMSLGYPPDSDPRLSRQIRGPHPESSPQDHTYPLHYPYGGPPNGYGQHHQHPSGWYPPPGPHMPPPPPPSSYDTYRGGPPPHHQQQQGGPPPQHYPPPPGPGYPQSQAQSHGQYYGSSSGRPQTHSGPYRHHQSAPPPGYVPGDQHVAPPGGHYAPPPPSAWHHQQQQQQQHMSSPRHSATSPYDRGPPSVPWPQGAQSQSQTPDHRSRSGSTHSRGLPQTLTPTHYPPPLPRSGSNSRPHSPPRGSRTLRPSPIKTNALQISGHGNFHPSPTTTSSSVITNVNAYARPPSSSHPGRHSGGEQPPQHSPVVLPPLSGSLSRPGSRGGRGGLPPIVTEPRGETGGSRSGSVMDSPRSAQGTGKTNRMGLGHLVD
ncbi:hypothetical protein CI109_106343 [Kwoniella shandongensis]|uniref:Velvet domain-containing protein n=1 Tax=Kwoniella shandongensis TaxID=1734106 RepID=A0A5M6BQ19_9TREE|nr:uncharacterized protein CI109_007452 [Kwoniella shandongensis]KAA5524212.1 hypothetical protein CI109_007452 [Kwoniella shandongensis]